MLIAVFITEMVILHKYVYLLLLLLSPKLETTRSLNIDCLLSFFYPDSSRIAIYLLSF